MQPTIDGAVPRESRQLVVRAPRKGLQGAETALGRDNNASHDDDNQQSDVVVQHDGVVPSLCDESFEDATPWPTNRCCYEELRPSELAAIEQLFESRDDAPLSMKWVILRKGHRRFVKRLLVISSFRLWVLQPSKKPFASGLTTVKSFQHLQLRKIKVLRTQTVNPNDPAAVTTALQLRYDVRISAARGHDDELHMDAGMHTESIVRLLQRQLHALRLAIASQADGQPTLLLPPQCGWFEAPPLTERDLHAQGEAITMAYRCLCDTLGVAFRPSVTTYLVDSLESRRVDLQQCLSIATQHGLSTGDAWVAGPASRARRQSPIVSAFSLLLRVLGVTSSRTSGAFWKELLALSTVLQSCHCFEQLVACDLPIGHVALQLLFSTLLSPSSSVSTIELVNVNLSVRGLQALQHVVLQSTIRRSADATTTIGRSAAGLSLRQLNVSFNRFSTAMAHALATILELLPNGLERLQLDHCSLSSASSTRVLGAMRARPGFSSCLRELNLAGNTLGRDGTHALALWITGAFALQHLDLSRTRLDTDCFLQSFKQNTILHESSLTSLDLSYNVLGQSASVDLGEILGKTQSLSTLFLRGMRQPPLSVRRRLADAVSRRRGAVTSRALKHAQRHARHKKQWRGIRPRQIALPCVTNGLRKRQLERILAPLFQNVSRVAPCRVDLSENDLRGRKAELLARLLDQSPRAARASLRLDYCQLSDKSAVLLLHSLRSCKTLDSLSLEGNGFVSRDTKRSYRRFHARKSHRQKAQRRQRQRRRGATASPVERAAADALSLLLGGKTSQAGNSPVGQQLPVPSTGLKPKSGLPLRELSLRAAGRSVFGPHVLTAAVQALAVNAWLKVLDVSGNECGDALAKALGAALPANRTLEVLYWDDNFTTVDGLQLFYDGLLKNQTISVVQLPINDTRRILEEQKDPPRERLFSVLGKIFKVTERNQTLAQAKAAERCSSHDRHKKTGKSAAAKAALASDNNSPSAGHVALVAGSGDKGAELGPETPEEPALPADESSVRFRHVSLDTSSSNSSSSSSSIGSDGASRYPSTMRSWSRDAGARDAVDLRASWDQISSLSTMSH
ncbi:hypothetical protein P43SY_008283 [Pythium insidiosum]|uniref:Uncharacterized protein n=1 Tax=Pythium insidiosum TaxID=114742 RepID=A0AAD5MHB6_PYTIN|nr:hypothetical protein P43SY_008283 [Pythium insidiosum]